MTDIDQLKKLFNNAYLLKEEELEALCSIWQPFECKRKTVLTAAGETERYLYFVLEGVQRAFYIGAGKKEATIVFMYPPSFSGIADSFLTQTPSLCFLETLTASRFLRTTHQQIEELTDRFPAIRKMILKLTSFALKGVLERQIELQCFSAEEKFRAVKNKATQFSLA